MSSHLRLLTYITALVGVPIILCIPSNAVARLLYPFDRHPTQSAVTYDPSTGDLWLDYGQSNMPNVSYSLAAFESQSGLFLTEGREAPFFVDGLLNTWKPTQILLSTESDILSFGFDAILPTDLSGEFLAEDLTAVAACDADACPQIGGLIVVPEPTVMSWLQFSVVLFFLKYLKPKPNVEMIRRTMMNSKHLRFEQLDPRVLLCVTGVDAYDQEHTTSLPATGNVTCIEVHLEKDDILVANLVRTSGTISPSSEPILEVLDDTQSSVIASRENGQLGTMAPLELSPVRDFEGEEAFLTYHAPAAGTYTLRGNSSVVSGGHDINHFISHHRDRPSGSRQYFYLDFNGEQDIPDPIGRTWNIDPGPIDSLADYLDALPSNIDYVDGEDADDIISGIVTRLNDRFPELEGNILTLDDQTDLARENAYLNDPHVAQVVVGEANHLSSGNGEAAYIDHGNFVWGDGAWVGLKQESAELASLELCTKSTTVSCEPGQGFMNDTEEHNKAATMSFLVNFISRQIAHEIGHSLGPTHDFNAGGFINDTRSVMASGLTKATFGLDNNTYVGDPIGSRLDFRYGGFRETPNLATGPGQLANDLYVTNEMRDRTEAAMAARGEGTGFWHSWTDTEHEGASIAAGELVYTGQEQASDLVVVTQSGSGVDVSVNGVDYFFDQVTRFRFIGRGGNDWLLIGGGVDAVDADFDNDYQVDDVDIDMLFDVVESGVFDDDYDLTQDGVVDSDDVNYMIHILLSTSYGDANLDGVFDSADLVLVMGIGNYNTLVESGWAEGDWDGDDLFGTSDLVVANVNSL